MKIRRGLVLLILLGLSAAVMSGCGGGPAAPSLTVKPGSEDVIITPISVDIKESGDPAVDRTDGPSNTPGPGGDTQTDGHAGPTPVVDPTQPLAGLVISVDAGHQDTGISEKEPCAPWGPDANSKVNNTVMKAKATSGTSGVSTKKTEYQVNLEIALKLRDALEAKGATVVMSRTDNSTRLSNMDRALMAKVSDTVKAIVDQTRFDKVVDMMRQAKGANIVLLGKLLHETGLFSFETVRKALEKNTPAKRAHTIDNNMRALQLGADYKA